MRLITVLFIFHLTLFCYSQQKEIDSIKQILSTQPSLEQVASLNELSWYYKNSNIDSSIHFANEALRIGRSLESKKAISASFNNLANAYSAKGLFDSALIYNQKAFSIKTELGDSLGLATLLNNQGIAYDELGDFDKALKAYFLSLRIYEKVSDDPYDIAKVLGNIGIVYKKQKEFEKVLEYYQKALGIYENLKSEFGITVTNGNIGNVLLSMGKYQDAINYCTAAKKGYENLGYTRYIPYMLCNIGIANDSLGNVQKARNLYLEAIEKHGLHENKYELSYSYNALASNYRKTKEFERSLEASLKSLSLAQEINALEWKVKGHIEVAKNYSALGKHNEAYQQVVKYISLNDSLFEKNKTKQIFELQTEYETEKKEQQIALQNAEISEQQAELERNRITIISSGILFVMLILIGILLRNRLKKKQQIKLQEAELKTREAEINATISSQERERARYARDLHDGFGQMISVLNMNLKNLQDGAKPDERQKVFDASEKVINEMYGELKNICFDLMPQTLIKHGLESALNEFAGRINQARKVFIELNVFGLEKRLTELQEISLYRISQEWVNNILKYSNADKITLQITRDETEITLLIEDNGAGFDQSLLEQGKGNGWKNLNTRAKLIQGELELENQVGKKGNVLILNIPVELENKKIEIQLNH
ncbi:MAG: DUF2225 domain-containing protein [Ekhidna sp.]